MSEDNWPPIDWSQFLIWDRPPHIQIVTTEDQPRRAEQMITRREPDGSITDLEDWGLAGIASRATTEGTARSILTEHLGPEAVERYQEAVERYQEGAERFDWVIGNLDPAMSAWNPVTGLEPVLCRVCGNSSDPRTGKVLTHPERYPCTPPVEPPGESGVTSQVRDTVLLRSANVREESVAYRDELQPWEVLSISVRAFSSAGFRQDSVPHGAVRECPLCLGVSDTPTGSIRHAIARCSEIKGYVVAELDPRELDVAACHVPGARSITDPNWYHLDSGWWVAPEGTKGPGWAEYWSASAPLAKVVLAARRPQPATPVRLTAQEREESTLVAQELDRLADYFRAFDRPETLHAVTDRTRSIAVVVRHAWRALESAHDEAPPLFHQALGDNDCPVCAARETSPATEREEERLAELIQARMANDGARRLPVKVVRVILREANRLQLTMNQISQDPFPLAVRVADLTNARVGSYPDLRGWVVSTADAARVLQAYRWHFVYGGTQ